MLAELSGVDAGLGRILSRFEQLSKRAQTEIVRGLNDGGDVVRTHVTRNLAQQSGAGYHSVRKALSDSRRAKGGSFVGTRGLRYEIIAKGEFMPLKAFGARQAKAGVSAAPWGVRRVFPRTFIASMSSGHVGVFARLPGAARLPIRELWGPAVPNEMLKGKTAQAFGEEAGAVVLPRIMSRLGKILEA